MTVIRINNFGGEIPRLPARALPPGAAQINQNLLATASEFRPLLDDSVVSPVTALGAAVPVPNGAKTLYRLSKDATEAAHTLDTKGWRIDLASKNYVKGQINDDVAEHTFVSFNNGTAELRTVTAKGADRVLGVPPPPSITVTLNAASYFTLADANAWVGGVVAPAIVAHVASSVSESNAGAGISSSFGMFSASVTNIKPSEFYTVWGATEALAAGLDNPQIYSVLIGATRYFPIAAQPWWGTLSRATLSGLLAGITNPQAGGAAPLSGAKLTYVLDKLVALYSSTDAGVKSLREKLDVTVKAFYDAIYLTLTVLPLKPVIVSRPTTPEWTVTIQGENTVTTMSTDWATYYASQTSYQTALDLFEAADKKRSNQIVARNASIVAAQAIAKQLVEQIEGIYASRKAGLNTSVKSILADMGTVYNAVSNQHGLVTVDPDKINETRFYFATYVTDWGEESAPSPVSLKLEVNQKDTVTVTVNGAATHRDGSTANYDKWRLYRSNAGNTATAFQFVADTAYATKTYTDAKKGAELGEVCPTITWLIPPYRMDSESSATIKPIKPGPGNDPFLKDLVGMPNGIMAAHLDNFVAFCEPYIPYAWPVEYQVPVEFPIVGKGVFGQTLFVGTTANPYLISGSDSASMSAIKLNSAQACVSARSIVALEGGVIYASPDGLCVANNSGVELLTGALFAREDWQLLEPKNIVAAAHEGIYYFWYTGNAGGCYALDTVAKKLTRVDMASSATFTDGLTDAVFYVSGTNIKRAFSTGRRTGVWKSSKIVLGAPASLAWLQVDSDFSAAVTVKWYGDGVLRYTATITSSTPVRVPSGRYLEHEIEILSAARITKVLLASTTEELKNV